MPIDMTRRAFLALSAAAAGTLAAAPALAMTVAQARALIDRVVEEINAVINSGRPERAMYDEFEAIMARHADVPGIALTALGAARRQASAAQQREFIAVFRGYIARKYGSRFREFIGGRLEVQRVRDLGSRIEVETTAFLRGEDPFEVTFVVSDRSGRQAFYNMYIEGVNMLALEREEIGRLLDRRGGNIDAMIRDLRRAA